MKQAFVFAVIAALTALPAVAQDRSPPVRTETPPPGGSYQGYLNSRDIPPEQTAQMPSDEQPARKPHPGTLRRFNSNSGYGPEVQFDVDRRDGEKQRQR